MVCKDTLRVKHLPKELTEAQKEDFVRHFGASKVKVITSKAKAKSVVYAKFENEDVAKNVMIRLHQISILNCRLCVEYAETDILQGQLTTLRVEDIRDAPDKKFFKAFINNVNAFNDSVGFYQPPPSHLKYNYPKANRPTINNIAHALATVPRFYIQVLHLMNKMNLPPPFAMPEPPVRTIPASQSFQPPVITGKRKAPASSSSESELESDGESNKSKEVIPEKRPVVQKKTLKRPKFIKQLPKQANRQSAKSVDKAENVFEKVEVQPQRKIELKVVQEPVIEQHEQTPKSPEKKNEPIVIKTEDEVIKQAKDVDQKKSEDKPDPAETLQEHIVETLTEADSVLDSIKKPQRDLDISQKEVIESNKPEIDQDLNPEPMEEKEPCPEISTEPHLSEDEFPCISLEELAANQITDLSVNLVFKSYNVGEPTNKLYIKNCSKTVVVQDLEYIYNRYREEGTEEKPSEFNIRLMQEGRMKGQAFVTLDSVEQAERAVKETNGFILKDKPLVVVFGKGGKKK